MTALLATIILGLLGIALTIFFGISQSRRDRRRASIGDDQFLYQRKLSNQLLEEIGNREMNGKGTRKTEGVDQSREAAKNARMGAHSFRKARPP